MAKAVYSTVDAYLTAQPAAARAVLTLVRQSIRRAVPDAEECISYQIPTYKRLGRPVLYFAGWKKHFSLYPATPSLLAAFPELSLYPISKGTIRFPLTDPVPEELIERIARFRAQAAVAPQLT